MLKSIYSRFPLLIWKLFKRLINTLHITGKGYRCNIIAKFLGSLKNVEYSFLIHASAKFGFYGCSWFCLFVKNSLIFQDAVFSSAFSSDVWFDDLSSLIHYWRIGSNLLSKQGPQVHGSHISSKKFMFFWISFAWTCCPVVSIAITHFRWLS